MSGLSQTLHGMLTDTRFLLSLQKSYSLSAQTINNNHITFCGGVGFSSHSSSAGSSSSYFISLSMFQYLFQFLPLSFSRYFCLSLFFVSFALPWCLFISLDFSYSFQVISVCSFLYLSNSHLPFALLSFPLISFVLHSSITMLQHLSYHDILTSVTQFIHSFLCVVACSPMKTDECAIIFLCSCAWVLSVFATVTVWSQHQQIRLERNYVPVRR